MKIVKKAKLPKITCELCGCVFRPEKGDLASFAAKGCTDMYSVRELTFVTCPVCGLTAEVFKKEGTDVEAKG